MSVNINQDVFNVFVRYMIFVAKNKRFVAYDELENIFGFSHNMVGAYAGELARFCNDHGYPLLNTLIINKTDMKPSYDMHSFVEQAKLKTVEENMFACFKRFHVTSTREKQVKDFSGLNDYIRDWYYTDEE